MTCQHPFYRPQGRTDCWLVACIKTGGEFSTNIFKRGYQRGDICPCCNEAIE